MLFTLRPYFEFFCLFYAYNIEYLSLIFTFYMYFTCDFWTPQLEEYQKICSTRPHGCAEGKKNHCSDHHVSRVTQMRSHLLISFRERKRYCLMMRNKRADAASIVPMDLIMRRGIYSS